MVKRPLSEHPQFAKCLNLEYPSEPEQTRLESPAITPGFPCIGWSPERQSAAPRCIPKGIVSVAKRPYGFTLKVVVGSRVSSAKKAPLPQASSLTSPCSQMTISLFLTRTSNISNPCSPSWAEKSSMQARNSVRTRLRRSRCCLNGRPSRCSAATGRLWMSLKPLAPACPCCSISTTRHVTSTAVSTLPINSSPESRRPVIVSPASGGQAVIVSLSNNHLSRAHEHFTKIPRHRPVLPHGHLGTPHPSGIHRSHDLLHSRLA